ncbi:hypothetical protein E2C01_088667 [Portunus trituberculatus]
MFNFP